MILNTVPAWKRAYKLRVAVFVEYESDVEEERGRVEALLENLRIQADVLVFWLASGKLSTYEVIVNGKNPGQKHEEEVEECLKGQDWWDELQKIRGKRGPASAIEDLSEIVSIFQDSSNWPEASFRQGPRGEGRVERFLGLRRLLRKSKRRHTVSGISRLGINLGMRTHRLSPNVVKQHASQGSASEDSRSESDNDSDSEAIYGRSDTENDEPESAASEADIDDFESESDPPSALQKRSSGRRKSHSDTLRGPPPSKKSTGEKEIKLPERPSGRSTGREPSTTSAPDFALGQSDRPGSKSPSVPSLATSTKAASEVPGSKNLSLKLIDESHRPGASSGRPASVSSQRPNLSRHASVPKFTSKPVPVTRIATEDGPGPSIMFTDTPSPPVRNSRLPSAYRPGTSFPDHIEEESASPTRSRRGSTYSTQAVPLSFNDLPCRAQHLILNELMRTQSKDTAVMFTTLPSPVEGTCRSEEASRGYLGDLEILCKGCPPVLMVHSNSMTVTMSL